MYRLNVSLVAILLALLFTLLQQNNISFTPLFPTPSPKQDVLPAITGSVSLYAVTKVVDGDTIRVNILGKSTPVRLIGINSPETVDPRREVECFGKEASHHMKELLTGRSVRLVSDPTQQDRDRYDRLLRYVYRDDSLFINSAMIVEGYAYEYTYSTPYQFQGEFKKAEKLAQEQKKGLWGAACQ